MKTIAAKLIVDALLQRFLPLARRRIETAQAQVIFLQIFHVKLHSFYLKCHNTTLRNSTSFNFS